AALTRQLLAFARKPALVRQRTAIVGLVRSTAELVTRTLHQEVRLELPPAAGGGTLLGGAGADPGQRELGGVGPRARGAGGGRGAGAARRAGGGAAGGGLPAAV